MRSAVGGDQPLGRGAGAGELPLEPLPALGGMLPWVALMLVFTKTAGQDETDRSRTDQRSVRPN